MDNILINFTADPAGLQPGIDGMEQLKLADKELEQAIVKTTAAEKARNKAVSDGAKASTKDVEGLATAMGSLSKIQLGGSFVAGLKTVSAEMSKIATIKASRVPFVDDVAARLKFLQQVTDQTKNKLNELPVVLNKIKPSAASATTALSNFGRVVQDAPFGILGIANNIDPLVESFQRLKTETGSTKGALQSMLGGLTGPAGIGIAISVVTSLIIAFGDEIADMFSEYFPSVQRANEKQKEFNDTMKESNDILVDLARSYASLYINRTSEAEKAISIAQAQGRSESEIFGLRQKASAARRLENIYLLASIGLTEQDVKLNEAQLQLLNEQLHAILAQANAKKGLSDEDQSRADNLKSQIAALKSTTDAGRDALKAIKEAQIESEVAAAQESRRVYENSIKSAVAAIEARVAAAKKGSIEERDAQIAAIKARVDAEKKLNVNLTAGERVKLEVEAQKQIQSIHFEYQKKALQDAKLGIDAQILQAQAGTEAEFDLRIQSLEVARQIELKDQELTNNKKQEINARYYKQSVELAKAFNQKVAENELNLESLKIQEKIAEIEYSNVEKNNVELITLKQDLIDQQAAIEAIGVTYSEKNEELRLAKTKLIYSKALASKQELERQKQLIEIDSAAKAAISGIQSEINYNDEQIQLAGRTGEQKRLLRIENAKNLIAIGEMEMVAAQAQYDKGLISFEQYQQKMTEAERKQSQGRIDISQAEAQAKQQIREAAEQIAINLIQVYTNISKKRYEDELNQARNMFEQKLITETEYNKRVAQVKREQARIDKIASIFSIAIKTAENIVDVYPNPILMALAAGLGASQTAIVASQPLPQYKKGKVDIDGPGTATSDSILARISKGESVINAESTSKYKEALEAINANKFPNYLKNLEMPKLWNQFEMPVVPKGYEEKVRVLRTPEIDYDKLGEVISQKLASHQQLSINMDEDGFTKSIKKGLQTIEYKNKKLLA